MSSIYKINKGINRSIEFKGLKAQYIWWLAGGIIAVMILFSTMYIAGLNSYICVAFALVAGGSVFFGSYHLSNKYGEHGMMKKMARGKVPRFIWSKSRKSFIKND